MLPYGGNSVRVPIFVESSAQGLQTLKLGPMPAPYRGLYLLALLLYCAIIANQDQDRKRQYKSKFFLQKESISLTQRPPRDIEKKIFKKHQHL